MSPGRVAGDADRQTSDETVLVAGAGLGGLTAALALLRQGRSVRVYEQAQVLGEVGAGISISPGAGRGLSGLGLEAELLAASLPVPDVGFAHYATGELLAGARHDAPPADQGFDTPRHFHRADLHAILLEAVRALDPEAVRPGKQLVRVEQTDRGVRAQFADGDIAQGGLLIGADGVRSAVRRQLFDTSAPVFAGQIAFRCLIPAEVAAPYLHGGAAVVSIGAGRIFHRYLLRQRTLLNVIGIAQTDVWPEEGWNTPATVQEFRDAFAGFNADVLGLIALSPPETLIKWGLFVRPPLDDWSRGRVVLLGDAAHPILPFLGLGAALAIEDGLVLARALTESAGPEAAFAVYQRARIDRVETVRTQTIRQGEIIQGRDPDRAGLAASPSQDRDLFDYDPASVALHS
jgi:salicylate hydroxylase